MRPPLDKHCCRWGPGYKGAIVVYSSDDASGINTLAGFLRQWANDRDKQMKWLDSPEAVGDGLASVGYQADRRLATAAFLALSLKRPLLLEGEPGVGKTELAKALAKLLGRPLIRLQCYDGLELRDALYEWNHAAQLLHMRAAQDHSTTAQIEKEIYQERFLIRRPLLQALEAAPPGALLLIDEVDRADEPFEAFLLEYLGEYQVTIPELGCQTAKAAPVTILTTNRTRDLHDAVKRRCIFHWLDFPERERELAILRAAVPQASERLTEQIALFVSRLRSDPYSQVLSRKPGLAESLEWARALVAMDAINIDPELVGATSGVLFKHREDMAAIEPLLGKLLLPEAA